MKVKLIPPTDWAKDDVCGELFYDNVFHVSEEKRGNKIVVRIYQQGGVRIDVKGGWRLEVSQ